MKQQRTVAGAALAALLVVGAAWFGLFWRSESAHLKAAEANQSEAVAQLGAARLQLANLQAEKPKLKSEEAVLAKLVEAVPNGPALDQMLRTINSAANAAGVTVSSVGTPAPGGWAGSGNATQPATSGAASLTVSIGASGTTGELLNFVTALDKQPRVYVVSSFGLQAPGLGAQAVSATFQVEAFYVSAASNNPAFPG